MKKFTCGDVVPGCAATFESATEEGIFDQIGPHAAEVHGLDTVPDDVITAVRASIVTA